MQENHSLRASNYPLGVRSVGRGHSEEGCSGKKSYLDRVAKWPSPRSAGSRTLLSVAPTVVQWVAFVLDAEELVLDEAEADSQLSERMTPESMPWSECAMAAPPMRLASRVTAVYESVVWRAQGTATVRSSVPLTASTLSAIRWRPGHLCILHRRCLPVSVYQPWW